MDIEDKKPVPIAKESLVRLALYRGVLQFGVGAALLFTILAVVRGDDQWIQHAARAFLAFPLFGALCGLMVWTVARLVARKSG